MAAGDLEKTASSAHSSPEGGPTETPSPRDAAPTSGSGAGPVSAPGEGFTLDPAVELSALIRADPPRVDDYWLDARLAASPSGVAYLAHSETSNDPVMVLLLSEGASSDAAARDRLAGQVDRMHIDTVIAHGGPGQDGGRMAGKYHASSDAPDPVDDTPAAPWAALAFDGSPAAVAEANRLLAEIDLSWLPQQGDPHGPDFTLPWKDRPGPGAVNLWPLPWPGRPDRAGKVSILASWLLMILLAALAVLLAILMFSESPQSEPPPPVPTDQPPTSPPPSSSPETPPTSPPPESSSPSETPSSPPPDSASPSPGETPSGSASPTPATASPSEGGGSGSPGAASNSPISKL